MNKNNTIVINEKTPLLVLAGPMFLELLLNTMLNNVDMLMLSHYDEYAVGAVGNANIILFMMNILFSIIAMATNVVAAQYLGAKLYKKMNMIYTLAVVVNLVFGLTLSAAFCVANPLIMAFLNVSPQMRPYSMIYIYIVGGGGFLSAVFNVMIQILRCNGYTKIGMWVTFSINLINIAGNYLFLYGPLAFLKIGRCLNMNFVSSLKAAGAYIFPFIAGLVCNWGLGLTTGYLVGVMLGIGVVGIYIGTAADECIRGLIVMSYWYRKKWLGKSVVDQKDITELA